MEKPKITMRKDAQIDKRQVKLPNASWMGFSKSTAQYGDFVVWNDTGELKLARVIGRVAYAPECGSKPVIRDYLMLAVLNSTCTSKFIRWVSPEEIQECYRPADYALLIRQTMEQFTSEEFTAGKPEEIAERIEQGF